MHFDFLYPITRKDKFRISTIASWLAVSTICVHPFENSAFVIESLSYWNNYSFINSHR